MGINAYNSCINMNFHITELMKRFSNAIFGNFKSKYFIVCTPLNKILCLCDKRGNFLSYI